MDKKSTKVWQAQVVQASEVAGSFFPDRTSVTATAVVFKKSFFFKMGGSSASWQAAVEKFMAEAGITGTVTAKEVGGREISFWVATVTPKE